MTPQQLKALLDAATKRPWWRGSRWKVAGTHPPCDPTRQTCAYCDESEPAEVVPYKRGEGVKGGAWHRHPNKDAGLLPTLDDDGSILCEATDTHRVEGPEGQPVCDNYDYESGGVVHEKDATAIVATMNAAEALVELWEALRSTGYMYRIDSEDPVERKIADALRRLGELP